MFVCVCVCVRTYVCVCVCVCVYTTYVCSFVCVASGIVFFLTRGLKALLRSEALRLIAEARP
jgi:hypothetical protein